MECHDVSACSSKRVEFAADIALEDEFFSSGDVHSRIRAMLDKEYEGYVVVTCKKGSKKGSLQVEMSRGEDLFLTSFLLEGAQREVDQDIESNA